MKTEADFEREEYASREQDRAPHRKSMDERIEAAARAKYASYGDIFEETWDGASPGVRASFVNDAHSVIAAAFPELSGDKPTHWLAPMEPTDRMFYAMTDVTPLAGYAWEAGRDAYLGKGDGG